MSSVSNNKVETIEIPVSYKNIFLKIVKKFSPSEVEERVFMDKEDYIFFSKNEEKELIGLESYKNLKNTINNKFGGK